MTAPGCNGDGGGCEGGEDGGGSGNGGGGVGSGGVGGGGEGEGGGGDGLGGGGAGEGGGRLGEGGVEGGVNMQMHWKDEEHEPELPPPTKNREGEWVTPRKETEEDRKTQPGGC